MFSKLSMERFQKSPHAISRQPCYSSLTGQCTTTSDLPSLIPRCLLTNHREFYVKTFRRGMQWIRQVAIHHANVQQVELELLEKHLG